jgi:hypothetical protein
MQHKIKRISGAEPRRDGEYPVIYALGFDGVVLIEEEQENLGTYGIIWFKAYKDDGTLVGKMNAAYVANVDYDPAI